MNIKDIDKISNAPRKGKKGFLKSLINLVGGGGEGSSPKLVLTPRYVTQQGNTVAYGVDVPFDDVIASDNIEINFSDETFGDTPFTAKIITTFIYNEYFVCNFVTYDLNLAQISFYKGQDNLAYFDIEGGK